MGNFPSDLFVSVEDLPPTAYGFLQLLFLGGTYAYILTWSSGLISDGSELLLLIPSLAGIVGSVVLPVLGAVPDGAIVLFSGMGPADKIQQQLSVGVGALAGSTIMLLTIPWALSILAGRVNITNGVLQYKKPPGKKLDPPDRYRETGIACSPEILHCAKLMIGTSVAYFVIQGSAFFEKCGLTRYTSNCSAAGERWFAFGGLIFCVAAFAFYLWEQVRRSKESETTKSKVEQVSRKSISKGLISLRGVIKLFSKEGESAKLVKNTEEERKLLRGMLRPFFKKYDFDNNDAIDASELRVLLEDLGESVAGEDFKELLRVLDTDSSGSVDFEEFVNGIMSLMSSDSSPMPMIQPAPSTGEINKEQNEDEDEEDEEAEMPEDLSTLSPDQQKRRILIRSFWMMGLGTLVTLIFSDPMVDVLNELGNRIHVAPFFVAFVLAPLASNASELLASYNYAMKKTEKTVNISLATLLGAATMNNTFCLGIFLLLVFWKGLAWEYSAETISIIAVELFMFGLSTIRVQKWWFAFVALACFPCSIALVVFLEQVVGLD